LQAGLQEVAHFGAAGGSCGWGEVVGGGGDGEVGWGGHGGCFVLGCRLKMVEEEKCVFYVDR